MFHIHGEEIIKIPRFGDVQFFEDHFFKFYRTIEQNHPTWRYSGECELLLFNIDETLKIIPNDFYAYNLDDIIRNRNIISPFIRETIHIGADINDPKTAKRRLDELFSDLITPPHTELMKLYTRWEYRFSRFGNGEYYFISYSTKDYRFVEMIRDQLEQNGINCWMAPRDIPHGSNYAHVIEFAIQHSHRFVLMLSQASIWSVWVQKELLRAIHYFQNNGCEKIVVYWVSSIVSLDNTPMGFPLEGVQIAGKIQSISDFFLLLPDDKQKVYKIRIRVRESIDRYQKTLIACQTILGRCKNMTNICFGVPFASWDSLLWSEPETA